MTEDTRKAALEAVEHLERHASGQTTLSSVSIERCARNIRRELKAPAVPEGWKLVPVEPTEDMLTEGIDAGRIDEDEVVWIWNGMLAVAPDPEDDHG